MKKLNAVLFATFLLFCKWSIANTVSYELPENPDWDPEGADIHLAYEWSTYDIENPAEHAPGAVLSAPGDMYSYTVIRSDNYANNEDYEIVKAIVGIHIDDATHSKLDTPNQQKWGRIEVNGEPRPFIVTIEQDVRVAHPTELVEIISDQTLTGEPGSSVPPYIFDVKDDLENGKDVRVTITNLRKDGQIQSKAPFGGFVINRVGAHVWYKKLEQK